MSPLLADLLVAIVAALVAGLIAIWSNSWLSRRNRRAEERIRFLLKAYADLEFASNRSKIPYPATFEKAIASIRLLGTPNLVMSVEKVMDGFATSRNTDMKDLLAELRKELRKELNLEPVPATHKSLRLSSQEKGLMP